MLAEANMVLWLRAAWNVVLIPLIHRRNVAQTHHVHITVKEISAAIVIRVDQRLTTCLYVSAPTQHAFLSLGWLDRAGDGTLGAVIPPHTGVTSFGHQHQPGRHTNLGVPTWRKRHRHNTGIAIHQVAIANGYGSCRKPWPLRLTPIPVITGHCTRISGRH